MEWVVKATPRPFYSREWPSTYCIGGWVGRSAGLDWCEKSRPPPRFIPPTILFVGSRYTHYAVNVHVHFVFIILEDDVLKWILEQEIIKLWNELQYLLLWSKSSFCDYGFKYSVSV